MSIYQPLNKTRSEIRILHLEGSTDENAPLRCELEIVSLSADPKPTYEAISYCWGDTTGRDRIILNGQVFEAPLAGAKVLRRFRLQDAPWTVWIDALCINQEDREERNDQVSLMGKVYRSTIRTLVWLGEPLWSLGHTLAPRMPLRNRTSVYLPKVPQLFSFSNPPQGATQRFLDYSYTVSVHPLRVQGVEWG